VHGLFKKKALTKIAMATISLILLLLINPLGLSAFTLGDVNDDGRIDVQDVTLVTRHVMGIESLSVSQMEAADVNADGNVDIQDITLITQRTLGMIDDFDDETETLEEIAVHFIDVGQGDSIFINTSEQNILIDGGNRGDIALNYLQDLGVEKIDLVIGTHPHADHIGGLINVMEVISVGEAIDPGVAHTTITFEDYLDIIDEKEITFTEGRAGMTRNLGEGAELKVVHPESPTSDHLNNASIVVRMTYGDISFLFTGDAEKEAEAEMLNRDHVLESTILKIGHHGSRTSTTQTFLDVVNPEVAIIMCGLDNTYGHPHEETLNKLSAANVNIYRTDLHGSVIITTDGSAYEINTDPYEHEDDPESDPEPDNDQDEKEHEDDPEPPTAGTVNINTASYEELQEIIHIGPSRAESIINHRPFTSIDGLTRVSGISPARLQDIKDEGIAYVE